MPTITWDVPEPAQESSFMNATLGDFAPDLAISVAVRMPCPAHIDPADRPAVDAWIAGLAAPLEAAGCEIEVQIGPSREALGNAAAAALADEDGEDPLGDGSDYGITPIDAAMDPEGLVAIESLRSDA